MGYVNIKLKEKNPFNQEQLTVLGNNIGVLWVSRINKAFRDGGYDDDKWKPSMVPNIGRILNLINTRKVDKDNARLKEAISGKQKTLVDTGALRDSFTYSVEAEEKTKNLKVNVGTNKSYAPNLHYGLPNTISITEMALSNIKELIKYPDYQFLRNFLKKRSITITPTKRKLISFDTTMRGYMVEAFNQWKQKNSEKGDVGNE